MSKFKQYRRTNIAEMRPYEEGEELPKSVSISDADIIVGSPKVGDMIARNPDNHSDQWLVGGSYFRSNFEEIEEKDSRAEHIEQIGDLLLTDANGAPLEICSDLTVKDGWNSFEAGNVDIRYKHKVTFKIEEL